MRVYPLKYIYIYILISRFKVEASGFGAKKEGRRYPWKTVAQKQEHRVPAIRIIASRDTGI